MAPGAAGNLAASFERRVFVVESPGPEEENVKVMLEDVHGTSASDRLFDATISLVSTADASLSQSSTTAGSAAGGGPLPSSPGVSSCSAASPSGSPRTTRAGGEPRAADAGPASWLTAALCGFGAKPSRRSGIRSMPAALSPEAQDAARSSATKGSSLPVATPGRNSTSNRCQFLQSDEADDSSRSQSPASRNPGDRTPPMPRRRSMARSEPNVADEEAAWQPGMNLGPQEPLTSLAEEFRHNASFVEKVRHLQSLGYDGWRRARGDGNCFYRSAAMGLLEQTVLGCGPRCGEWTDALEARLRAVAFKDAGERDAHSRLIGFLESQRRDARARGELGRRRLRAALNDKVTGLDLALVRCMRRLTADYLCENRDNPDIGNGLTPAMLCEYTGFESLDAFNEQVTLKMGKEAQDVAVHGLPLALDISLRVLLLDRKDGSQPVPHLDYGPALTAGSIDWERAAEWPLVRLQFRPGHYDLLYWGGPDVAS